MKIIRSVNTNNECIEEREYMQSGNGFKPSGLWYSINNEWIEWVKENMPDWEKGYNHIINVDTSKLLIINNIEELETFIELYKGFDDWTINWGRVAREYKGIEVRNYWNYRGQSFGLKSFRTTWFHGLDCSSGCIWNMDCITL